VLIVKVCVELGPAEAWSTKSSQVSYWLATGPMSLLLMIAVIPPGGAQLAAVSPALIPEMTMALGSLVVTVGGA